jgi:hypothetical protein
MSSTAKTTIGLRGGNYVVVPMSAEDAADALGLRLDGVTYAGFVKFEQANGFPAYVDAASVVSIVESDPNARKPAKTVFLVGGSVNVEQGDGRKRRTDA